jgi:hypothetical protein
MREKRGGCPVLLRSSSARMLQRPSRSRLTTADVKLCTARDTVPGPFFARPNR